MQLVVVLGVVLERVPREQLIVGGRAAVLERHGGTGEQVRQGRSRVVLEGSGKPCTRRVSRSGLRGNAPWAEEVAQRAQGASTSLACTASPGSSAGLACRVGPALPRCPNPATVETTHRARRNRKQYHSRTHLRLGHPSQESRSANCPLSAQCPVRSLRLASGPWMAANCRVWHRLPQLHQLHPQPRQLTLLGTDDGR
jgi:hypothetical protein